MALTAAERCVCASGSSSSTLLLLLLLLGGQQWRQASCVRAMPVAPTMY
jgi:hypothetical protein